MTNFMGLVIITEFEEFLSQSLKDDYVKKLLNNEDFQDLCLTIARTSSRNATAKIKGNRLEDLKLNNIEAAQLGVKVPRYIGITKRTCPERIMYVTYKGFRVLYVSVWFYFMPFIFMWLQYTIPRCLPGSPLVTGFE